MGYQRHTGCHLRIPAQGIGDDDRIQPKRHCQRAKGAGCKGLGHGNQKHRPQEQQWKSNQPQGSDQVHTLDFQDFSQIEPGDGHAG